MMLLYEGGETDSISLILLMALVAIARNFEGYWSGSLVTLGFVLGENQWVQKNLELVIFLIVAAATAPVIIKAISGRGKARPTGDA